LEVDKADARVWELIDKFSFVLDETLEDRKRGLRGVRMEMSIGGETHECMMPLPKGDPEKPCTQAEIREKTLQCAGSLLDAADVETLLGRASNFGSPKRFSPIIAGLPASPRA